MSRIRKYSSIACIIVILSTLVASLWFLCEHTIHNCSGDSCPVCYQLQEAEYTIRQVSQATVGAVFTGILLLITASFLSCKGIGVIEPITLVSLKVRLDD